MRITWMLLDVLISGFFFFLFGAGESFNHPIFPLWDSQKSKLPTVSHFLTPLDHHFKFFRWRLPSLIPWKNSGDLCLRKSCSFSALQPQWLLLDRQREPTALFRFWHLKGPDTIQNPKLSPRPGKFILTTELLCCHPSMFQMVSSFLWQNSCKGPGFTLWISLYTFQLFIMIIH